MAAYRRRLSRSPTAQLFLAHLRAARNNGVCSQTSGGRYPEPRSLKGNSSSFHLTSSIILITSPKERKKRLTSRARGAKGAPRGPKCWIRQQSAAWRIEQTAPPAEKEIRHSGVAPGTRGKNTRERSSRLIQAKGCFRNKNHELHHHYSLLLHKKNKKQQSVKCFSNNNISAQ